MALFMEALLATNNRNMLIIAYVDQPNSCKIQYARLFEILIFNAIRNNPCKGKHGIYNFTLHLY